MKKAFTIIELLVAMALMTALITASAVVFSTSVKAQRTAQATTEIMTRLAAICGRLNADFAGLRPDMPLAIWCQYDTTAGRRFDQILFFADGDFQSVRQYGGELVHGAAARIYYGNADLVNFNNRIADLKAVTTNYWNARILARRQHILTSQTMPLAFPAGSDFASDTGFIMFSKNNYCNDLGEYDACSLTNWKNTLAVQTNADKFLKTNFFTDLPMAGTIAMGNSNPLIIPLWITPPPPPVQPLEPTGRPGIDLNVIDTLPSLMAQGLGGFAVQMAQTPGGGSIVWYPSEDPNGDGDTADSDFNGWNNTRGYYYNLKKDDGTLLDMIVDTDGDDTNDWQGDAYLPAALKFTFTLYDSAGIFPQGRTFTHIVYLDK